MENNHMTHTNGMVLLAIAAFKKNEEYPAA
jgi:hypothetical protein